jgi:hypothetical protein
MTNRKFLRKFAAATPGGVDDPGALSKLIHEFGELIAEVLRLKVFDAATEVADIHYYHAKLSGVARVMTWPLLIVAAWLVLSPLPLGGWLARTKYGVRTPTTKNKEAERRACAKTLIVLWLIQVVVAAIAVTAKVAITARTPYGT